MDFDIELAKNCGSDVAFFRLYRWKPYCVSLGANQNLDEINFSKLQKDNFDFIKRPTGGRAILHAEEITYSLVYPINKNTSARNLYNQINLALKTGLQKFDERLKNIELEDSQINFPKFYKNKISNICFAASARCELKYDGKKIVGSAQKKYKNSILQHGSILCGNYHKKIVDYLNLTDEDSSLFKSEIENKTIDLKSILDEEINYKNLADSLVTGFGAFFGANFSNLDTDTFSKNTLFTNNYN